MRRLRWMPAAVGVLLLSGCVSIPMSGDVQTEAIDTEPDEVTQVVLPPGPVDGQSPAEIVQGFIRAGRAPQGPYSVARQFLTSDAAADWSGTARVLVSQTAINPVQVDDDTWTITVVVEGEVDPSGRYTVLPAQQQTLSYDVAQVDGQNRITRAEAGTVLTRSAFTTAFRAYPLYFFEPSFDYLVPDLRWFPATRTVAARIVQELLLGSSWLGPGVTVSAFPEGTEARNVDYTAPEVAVDLDSAVRSESPATQRRILQQLTTSLDALTNVTDITVTAGGLGLDLADSDVEPETAYAVQYAVIGGIGGRLGVLGVDGVSSIPVIEDRADELVPNAASLGRDRRSAAVLGAEGVSLVTESGPVLLDARPGLLAPTLDVHGFVWSVPRSEPSGLLAIGSDGVAREFSFPVDGEVLAIETSRDGSRLLAAFATADGPRLLVFGIQRDADLAPVALGGPYELAIADSVLDVAWVDGTHVAVLSSGADGTRVDVLALGGPSQSLGEIDGAVQIVGGNLVAGIRVLLADGSVLRPSDAGGWRDTGLTASFLGTQQ